MRKKQITKLEPNKVKDQKKENIEEKTNKPKGVVNNDKIGKQGQRRGKTGKQESKQESKQGAAQAGRQAGRRTGAGEEEGGRDGGRGGKVGGGGLGRQEARREGSGWSISDLCPLQAA